MRRNDSLPFGRSSARSGADEDIVSGAGLGRHVFGPISRGCGHSGDQRGKGDLALVRKRAGSGCAAGAGLDVQDGDCLGGAGSGFGQGCRGTVAGSGGGEFADGVAEIPQPAFRSFGGGVGGRGFGWVCGAERPDSGKGSGEVDGGAGEGGEAWGGFDDDDPAGASGGGGLDVGETSVGRDGGPQTSGGSTVEGSGKANPREDRDLWGIGVGERVWSRQSGDGLAARWDGPPTRGLEDLFRPLGYPCSHPLKRN